VPRACRYLDEANVHPLIKALWRPRLVAALNWIAEETLALAGEGRRMIDAERSGTFMIEGVEIRGKADRIDRLPDGTLAIVDYKTGKPPSARQVEAGYALQLGLLGMMAERGGFAAKDNQPEIAGKAAAFEYWSLTRSKSGDFGYRETPVGRKNSELTAETMLPTAEHFLREALHAWILGDAPFTAKLVPDQATYTEYDQLMRLAEWYGRQGSGQ